MNLINIWIQPLYRKQSSLISTELYSNRFSHLLHIKHHIQCQPHLATIPFSAEWELHAAASVSGPVRSTTTWLVGDALVGVVILANPLWQAHWQGVATSGFLQAVEGLPLLLAGSLAVDHHNRFIILHNTGMDILWTFMSRGTTTNTKTERSIQ